MASSSKNYSRSMEASKKLCRMILEYYNDHPSYPKDFARRIKTQLFTDTNGNVCIRSNLDELLANIVDVEQGIYYQHD
jgi:hypothetical protein